MLIGQTGSQGRVAKEKGRGGAGECVDPIVPRFRTKKIDETGQIGGAVKLFNSECVQVLPVAARPPNHGDITDAE
jgi:hypothetical protein